MLRLAVVVALLSLAASATIGVNKKEGYGGSSYGAAPAPSYGTGGGSYDASSYNAAAPAGGDASYSNAGAATSYGGASGAPASYSGTAGSQSYGAPSSGDSSSDSYGNLYYYYYPVTNHSSGPSSYGNNNGGGNNNNGGGGNYGQQGAGSYGGGSPNYYPPAPVGGLPFSDPLGGLLSVIGTIDINSLILPALLIAGVALVLPAILNCDLELGTCVIPLPFSTQNGAGRSRREAESFSMQQVTIPQMIDHAYNIYDAVYESEQCMERVVCELGGMMRNIRGKETFFSVLEHIASPTIKKQLKVLKEGALPALEETTSCDKFMCGRLDNKVD